MAHSVTYGKRAEYLTPVSIKSGKSKTVKLSAEELAWAIEAAECRELDLARIEGRIGDIRAWAELYGFDER